MGTLTTALNVAKSAERELNLKVIAAREALDAADKALVRAERYGHNARYFTRQSEYEQCAKALATLSAQLDDAKAATHAAETALEQVHAERWQRRYAQMRALVERGSDVMLSGEHGVWRGLSAGQYVVALTERDADGRCVARYGFDVRVYAPILRWSFARDDANEYTWHGAQVNWGTMGSVDVETAQALMRLYSAAVALATMLDETRDAWYAEDMAD